MIPVGMQLAIAMVDCKVIAASITVRPVRRPPVDAMQWLMDVADQVEQKPQHQRFRQISTIAPQRRHRLADRPNHIGRARLSDRRRAIAVWRQIDIVPRIESRDVLPLEIVCPQRRGHGVSTAGRKLREHGDQPIDLTARFVVQSLVRDLGRHEMPGGVPGGRRRGCRGDRQRNRDTYRGAGQYPSHALFTGTWEC